MNRARPPEGRILRHSRSRLLIAASLCLLGPAARGSARAEGTAAAASAERTTTATPDAGTPSREMTEEEAAPPPEPETPPPAEANPAKVGEPLHLPAAAPARSHVVSTGDSLSSIAHKYGVTVGALAAENSLGREATIRVGQRLVIPSPGEPGRASARVHVVVSGNTLGGIARHYGVSVEALLSENHLRRSDRLHIDQKLFIPGDSGAPARPVQVEEDSRPSPPEQGIQELSIPGTAPAYYFEPSGPGRTGMRPVIVYLHGRGAEPKHYCERWSRVARHLGWLVCPSGPEDRGDGKRGWSNNWAAGRNVVMNAIDGLRKKYGRRVQLYGNTLVGFSEGAFVAMNVGLREPHTFNRWLILGADTDYWGASGMASLPEARGRVRRVYLITGRHDDVYDDADQVRRWLKNAGVPVRVSTPKDMGHEVALETKPAMYQAALRWLSEG